MRVFLGVVVCLLLWLMFVLLIGLAVYLVYFAGRDTSNVGPLVIGGLLVGYVALHMTVAMVDGPGK